MKTVTKLSLVLGILVAGGIFIFTRAVPSDLVTENIAVPPARPSVSVSVLPDRVIQGDPVLIGIGGASAPASVSLNGKSLGVFPSGGGWGVLAGVDLNAKPGTSTVAVASQDGSKTTKEFVVEARKKLTAPLGIPEKLGGNTTTSVQTLVDTLESENATLVGLATADHALWQGSFGYPVDYPVVTDPYGYSRQTGSASIAHKGTDFRAPEGTVVKAMNRGEVRLVREYRNYGKTIVIDHGLGVMTFYMHLSRIDVKAGETIEQGQAIGLSGQTGYAAEPHLHLTVRINDVSIDPIVFLGLW